MTVDEIIPGVLSAYAGTVVDRNWGERGIFYNPGRALPKGIYLMTFKGSNGPHDKASDLDRDGVFRLHIGIFKRSYQRRFGALPFRLRFCPPRRGDASSRVWLDGLDMRAQSITGDA